jgi:hypothetical protein
MRLQHHRPVRPEAECPITGSLTLADRVVLVEILTETAPTPFTNTFRRRALGKALNAPTFCARLRDVETPIHTITRTTRAHKGEARGQGGASLLHGFLPGSQSIIWPRQIPISRDLPLRSTCPMESSVEPSKQ